MKFADMRKGTIVAITRASGDDEALAARLRSLGARVLPMPTIMIHRRPLTSAGTAALRRLTRYDALLFTSAHAVRFFAQELRERGIALPERMRIAAVGPTTAKTVRASLRRRALVGERFTALDLVRGLGDVRGSRVLFPRSAIAPSDAVRDLRRRGARVTVMPIYDNVAVQVPKASRDALARADSAHVVFASPSAVRGLLASVRGRERRALLHVTAVCIGPRTSSAARRAGFLRVHAARTPTVKGLVATLRALP